MPILQSKIHERIHLSPSVWPGKALKVQPGDLRQFAPMGNGLGMPMVISPWDSLESLEKRPGYYSFHAPSAHPLQGAPVTEPAGGTIYFDRRVEQANFAVLLRLMEVYTQSQEYVAFLAESDSPQDDRFIVQLRLMSRGALNYLYDASPADDPQLPAQQPLNIGDALWAFIEDQLALFGDGYSPRLEGCMGGDGDWAREALCFGFCVENSYHGICRIWSRAWLVTK